MASGALHSGSSTAELLLEGERLRSLFGDRHLVKPWMIVAAVIIGVGVISVSAGVACRQRSAPEQGSGMENRLMHRLAGDNINFGHGNGSMRDSPGSSRSAGMPPKVDVFHQGVNKTSRPQQDDYRELDKI